LQENQNTNGQEQPKEENPAEVQQNFEPATPETSIPASPGIKEETPILSTQGQTTPDSYRDEPQTETMEVHKHPHHVMHKKKWNEYLLEFFMLFLAVFLGFVAENIREHQVEKRRAKEFARLLVGDLATDTSELSRSSRVLGRIILAGDSLGHLLDRNQRNLIGGKLYYYEYWSGWQWNTISQDATLQQLKASGALRYFSTDIVRQLMDYEQSINVIYLLQNKYEPEKTANWNLVQKVFDQHYFNALDSIKEAARDSTAKTLEIKDPELIRFLNTDYRLLSYNAAGLQEIKNWALNSSRGYRTTRKDINHAKEKAKKLIEVLSREYSLTDSKL